MNVTRKLSVICAVSLITVIMYSAPNANIYAAATGSNGLSNPTHNSKSLHASVSAPSHVNDGVWNEFSFFKNTDPTFGCQPADGSGPTCTPSSGFNSAPVGSPIWTVTVPSNAHAIFTVTDAFNKGDNFDVYDGVTKIGTTPHVNTNASAATSDPATTSSSSGINGWSHSQFTLGSGIHALNVKTVSGSVDPFGGAAYFKVDLACDSSFVKGVTTTATNLVCVHIDIPTAPNPVGGMGIPIDSTALLLAGVQGSALWMIPAIVVAGAGIGLASFKRSVKKD